MLVQITESQEDIVTPQKALGIDFGTTNCVISLADFEHVKILRNDQGNALIPSVVFKEGDAFFCGEQALEKMATNPDHGVRSIKRYLGLESKQSFFEDPIDIAKKLFEHLKYQAKQRSGEDITQAVITVPAYFDDKRRTAIRKAATLAGFEVLRLLAEPTSAALAYGLEKKQEGFFGVYDLGGGTFDFSLLKLTKGIFQVLGTGGDPDLGGDDFDELLADHLYMDKSMAAILKAKTQKENMSGDLLESFKVITKEYVDKTFDIIEETLASCKIETSKLQGIILAGGSTKLPFLKSAIEERFHVAVFSDVNADEVVGLGAGYQAQSLISPQNRLLLDVTPLSLGIETLGGIMDWIIPRNTAIPTSKTQTFTTHHNNQRLIKIHVLQGERELASHCRSLGEFVLGPIDAALAGTTRIDVTFYIDADGLLSVEAKDQNSSQAKFLNDVAVQDLKPEEVLEILKDSAKHSLGDITQKLLMESVIKGTNLIDLVESILTNYPEDRETYQIYIEELKLALKSENVVEMHRCIEQLAKATEPLAVKNMQNVLKELDAPKD